LCKISQGVSAETRYLLPPVRPSW